jgi:hypothetical protein
LALWACAATAQQTLPSSTPASDISNGERARRDADRVFDWIRVQADKPRKPAATAATAAASAPTARLATRTAQHKPIVSDDHPITPPVVDDTVDPPDAPTLETVLKPQGTAP